MDNSVLLQKQIRDNSEDLQNFMRDLKHWEKEMKRKDESVKGESSDSILPPVRRKVTKISNNSAKNVKTSDEKPKKRIASYDYSAWDKLDVDKICEEIDQVNEEVKDKLDQDGVISETDENSKREYAMYEKDLGNQYVKQGSWDKAIESYTRAINSYPEDAIFYANRALCYLKKDKFNEVVTDCTLSLHLDDTYVKAYQRRAVARQKLGNLVEARQDFLKIIELEPKNMQAKKDLAAVDAKLKIENENYEVKYREQQKSGTNSEVTCTTSEIHEAVMKAKPIVEIHEPTWNADACVIDHVQKHPHLRSRKPLQRIDINDISNSDVDDTRKLIAKFKIDMQKHDKQDVSEDDVCSRLVCQNAKLDVPFKLRNSLTITSLDVSIDNMQKVSEEVPPVPKSSIQFQMHWNKIRSKPNLCYQYLKQISGHELPVIFKESLESDIFSNILAVLVTEFIKNRTPVIQYLLGLTKVRRFSALTLFMTKHDKANVSKLLEFCRELGDSEEDIAHIIRWYEL